MMKLALPTARPQSAEGCRLAQVFVALCLLLAPAPGFARQHPPSLSPQAPVSAWMRAIFGNYDAKTRTSRATVPAGHPDLKGSGFSAGDPILVYPFWSRVYGLPAHHEWVFLTYAIPNGPSWQRTFADVAPFSCHSCAPLVGMHLLRKTRNGWTVGISSNALTTSGAFGQPSDLTRQIPIGPGVTGIELMDSFGGQGFFEQSVYILTFWHSQALLSFHSEFEASDLRACTTHPQHPLPRYGPFPCFHWIKSLRFQPHPKSAYDDLIITQRGTHLDPKDNSRVLYASGTQTWQYREGKYILVSQSGPTIPAD
jgi:hypothetical protein